MSIEFPKNKGKRSRSSSNEANNSFVKNVTSRVSGLLPAAITKWFSSPSSSDTNGSTPVADTDSSTDDERHDPITVQPPAKRPRFTSDTLHANHYGLNDANNINYTAEPSTSYSPVLTAPSRRTEPFIREPIYSRDDPADTADRESKTWPQMTVSQITQSIEKKRNYLFGSDSHWTQDSTSKSSVHTSNNTVKDTSQPCFKPSLLSSPFYSGRTMYGGASSSYLNQSNVKLRKVAVVNESPPTNNTVSRQAQKVMELLEHYSSPLAEARRLPQYTRSEAPVSRGDSLDPATNMLARIQSYKTQELHVPSVASFLRIKQRSRLNQATSAARQILASRSSTQPQTEAQPYPARPSEKEKPNTSKFTSKVKSRLTRQNRGESNDETEIPKPLDLPSGGLVLDGGKLPTFSFCSSVTSTPKPAAAPSTVITVNPAKRPAPSQPKRLASEAFTFSSPIRIASEPHDSEGPPEFTFPSPDRRVAKKKCFDDVDQTPRAAPPPVAAKDWTCDGCWVTNKPTADLCVCCGGSKPTSRPTPPAASKCTACLVANSQSHVNMCVNCEKSQGNVATCGKPETIPLINNLGKSDSKDWKCDDCWVMNKPASAKCVACGGARPSAASKPTSNVVPIKPLTNNISKPDAGKDWRCDDCWVNNKQDVNKCVACGGARPGVAAKPAPAPAVSAAPASVAFSGKFDYSGTTQPAAQAKWECTSCLVRNDHNKLKCLCCDAEKPGADKPAGAPAVKYDFGVSSNMFKFGINHTKLAETPKPETTADAKPEETNKVESETNNNVVPKATFSFGVPANKDKPATQAAAKDEAEKTPKVGFTFGIPAPKAQNADATPGKFSFSASILKTPSTPKLDTDKDKEQVVPKLPTEEVKTVTEAPKATLNTLSSAFTPTASSEKTNALITPLVSSASSEKKEAPNNPLTSNPLTNNPLTSNPLTNNPLTSNPLTNNPLTSNPVTNNPLTSNPLTNNPLTSNPLTNNPLTSNPLTNNPLTSNPLTNNPLTSNPLTNNPLTSNSLTLAPAATSAAAQPSSFGAGINLNSMFASPTATSAVSFTLPAPALAASPAPPMFGAPAATGLFQKSEAPTAASAAPVFTLGATTTQADAKPKFNFTFSKTEPSAMFKPTFGATDKFAVPSASTAGPAPAAAPASLSTLPTSVFGTPKENMWTPQPPAPAATANMFATIATTNATAAKPAFSFGSTSAPAPAFPATTAFGGATAFGPAATSTPSRPFGGAAPAFGSATNMFGMTSAPAANGQASPFSSSAPAANIFGSPPAPASAAPAGGLFGSLATGATPTFGTPASSAPTFGAPPPASVPSLTPSIPAFNFGAQQQSPALFGFGQSAPAPPQAGVYNFGAAAGAAPVQFNMGSGTSPLNQPAPAARKIRKATRRANLR